MPKSGRLLFNFGEIFNDHRKLCYLFVDVASFKTVQDFKSHVQLGFNIKEPIFFSDNDNVLFPDFDDIRSLIDSPEVIWVRKLENHLNSCVPENNVPATVNTSPCNFHNDNTLICCSDLFNGQDEVRFTKSKKDKKMKKRKKGIIEDNSETIINTLEENNKTSSIQASDFVHTTENNNYVSRKRSSNSKVNDVIKADIESMIFSCDEFDKNSSDRDPEVSASNTGKLGSYSKENFHGTNNDLIAKSCNENINYLGSPMKEGGSQHSTNGEKTYGVDRLSDFGKNHSVSNSTILSEDDILCESVVGKVKRKRKRIRKRKRLEVKDLSFDKDDDLGKSGVKTEICTHKVSNSKQKHIRFDSDNELDDTIKDSGHLLTTGSSEPKVNESSEFDNRVKFDTVSVAKTNGSESSHISVMSEVSENISKNIVDNFSESEKIKNSYSYQNGKLDLHLKNNVEKIVSKNWDRREETSEMICGELLKLKDMVKKTSYFNPPVFNRTPKVSINSKNALQKPPEITKSNLSVSDGSSLDQSVNTSCEIRSAVDDVTLKVDDIVNFKILFLSADYTPTISDNVMGRVISVTDDVIKFKILLGLDICKPLTGKFSLTQEEDKNEDYDIVELKMEDLISPKKIINPFSVLNQ